MRKTAKIILGVVTIIPLSYIFFFMAFIFANVVPSIVAGHQPTKMEAWFPIIFIMHFGTIILTFVLLTFYIINVFKNPKVPKDKKTLWAVVLFLGNMFAMPVYWYIYIWKSDK